MLRTDKEFFIDCNGKIYKYHGTDAENITSIHNAIAAELYPDIKHPVEFVMRKGWILVGSVAYNGSLLIHKQPSQSQVDILFDLNMLDYLYILTTDRVYIQWNKQMN